MLRIISAATGVVGALTEPVGNSKASETDDIGGVVPNCDGYLIPGDIGCLILEGIGCLIPEGNGCLTPSSAGCMILAGTG